MDREVRNCTIEEEGRWLQYEAGEVFYGGYMLDAYTIKSIRSLYNLSDGNEAGKKEWREASEHGRRDKMKSEEKRFKLEREINRSIFVVILFLPFYIIKECSLEIINIFKTRRDNG